MADDKAWTLEMADDKAWTLEMADDKAWTLEMADDKAWALEMTDDVWTMNRPMIAPTTTGWKWQCYLRVLQTSNHCNKISGSLNFSLT